MAAGSRSFRVTPLDIMLCVDSVLVSVVALMLVLERFNPGHDSNVSWALRGGAAIALGFLALRSRSRKTDPRPASTNAARRVGGLLLMGTGGTLTVLGLLLAFVMLVDFKTASDFVWLGIPAVPVLIGNVGIYLGGVVRAPAARATDGRSR
jgi:hypothetical protein